MTGSDSVKIGGLLLAAGGSSRMGRAKQLVRYRGQSLIRHAAEALAGSACDPVVVVLGAETDRCRAEIADMPINVCVNKDWQAGMSSSIKAGLGELLRIEPDLDALMITLCDQPHVTSGRIDLFTAEFHASRATVIAAQYAGTRGVPALFSLALFGRLLKLQGDKGARDVIRDRSDVVTIPFEEAAVDIDTKADAGRFEA